MILLSLPQLGTTLITIFGIGLVIFVHELGHFLCARAVGVRVEVFSLGFGPRLFGFRRGATDFRVALVPIGGYVKMAGDAPGEGEGRSDELMAKSVGQRFLVYSGGVIMNVVFALVTFPLVFAAGVPMVRPQVGAVTPGGPAWRAGLEEGDEILAVNGRTVLGFTDIVLEIALADPERTELAIARDGEERIVPVRPEYNESTGSLAIQVGQPTSYVVRVAPDGPAARAGLADGDRIETVNGRAVSERRLLDADLDPGAPLLLGIVRADGSRSEIALQPELRTQDDRLVIGVLPFENRVRAVRGSFARADAPLAEGDHLLAVAGRTVSGPGDLLEVVAAHLAVAAAGEPLALAVERDGAPLAIALDRELAEALVDDVALAMDEGAAAGGAGVPIRVGVDSPGQRAGLRTGMRVLAVSGEQVSDWNGLRRAIASAAPAGDPVEIVAAAGEVRGRFAVSPEPLRVQYLGFDLETADVERRYGLGQAFFAGLGASWNFTRQAYLMLRQMVARKVSPENLGGIVAISQVSYRFAERGLAKLFYFLALLSINLAVINLLPVPVLDGGHLTFLLVEKVKGSPVNDRVMGYSQVFGLMVILSLLIFVTYNDIDRLLSGP